MEGTGISALGCAKVRLNDDEHAARHRRPIDGGERDYPYRTALPRVQCRWPDESLSAGDPHAFAAIALQVQQSLWRSHGSGQLDHQRAHIHTGRREGDELEKHR